MKLIFTRIPVLLIASVLSFNAAAQQNFFSDISESEALKSGNKREIIPEKYRTLQLDTASLLPFLRSLPSEQTISDRNATPVLALPMPDGSTARFHLWESSAMAPELAAAYPNIRTYTGQGIDDRTATIKLDWTEFGFHAMLYSAITGDILIDPYDQKTVTAYISYFKKDYKKKGTFQELGPIGNTKGSTAARPATVDANGICIGAQLRTYRLAVACTVEYARAATGSSTPTKAQTLAKVVTTVNRVNGVYEKEVAVRLVLIANDTAILFTDDSTDPFNGNNNGNTLINESQTQITNRIGNANFDIGHTFSTGGGGLAAVGVVCRNGNKASGITGSTVPVGDAYDIDYVAHEIGHEFGGQHTFNSLQGACEGNGNASTNTEPGSGTTIMAYAGICNSDDLQPHSNDYFNAISFDEITQYTNNSSGNNCAVTTSTGNMPPVVNAGADYVIPKSTPFVLTGTASDANGDALTYCWEQVDIGGSFGVWNAPSGDAPIFRSFSPVSTGIRFFPKLSDQIGNTTTIGEVLPSYARTMHFRLTARDNRAGGGGVCYDENVVTVANSGPFTVSYPNASGIVWNVNEFQTVTWNPAGTAAAPVNCANVSIQLSTDGGNTFPITIISSTPNDGMEEIHVPNNVSATCRIRVIAAGNIFYDMSNANFRIQNPASAGFSFSNPVPVSVCVATPSVSLLTSSLGASFSSISLSATSPAGTTVSFSPATLSPGDSTIVTLNNAGSLAPGTYTITVTGVSAAATKTRNIQFIIPAAATAPALVTPAADTIGQPVFPSFSWATTASLSYTLEISTASDFSAAVQIIPGITSVPYVLTAPLLENTIYYWRVKSTNLCGAVSSPGVTWKFKTGISSCKPSYDVPKTISASGTPTVTSTITIPAAAGVTITDLNVINVTGTHNWVGDLTISLKGPNNTNIILMSRRCDNDRYLNFGLTFDDAASITNANISCPPTGGAIVRPASALSAFNGINSAGTWTLTVKDNADGDGGELTGWGLNINAGSATGCFVTSTPLAIIYTFTGNGNWDVPANWSSNTIPPNPLPAGSSIVIDNAAGGSCILNVAQTISQGATFTVMTGKNLVVPGALTIQ